MPTRVTVTDIVAKTFRVLGARLGAIIAVALIVHVPVIALELLDALGVFGVFGRRAEGVFAVVMTLESGRISESALISLGIAGAVWMTALVAQGALTFVVVEQMAQLRPGVGSVIARSFGRLPTILVTAAIEALIVIAIISPPWIISYFANDLVVFLIAMGLTVPLGLVALWLISCFWVAIPAVVAERLGPIAALRRSVVLTRGSRFTIVGVLIVTAALMIPVAWGGAMLGMVFLAIGGTLGAVLFALLTTLTELAQAALFATASAVTYVRLRTTREHVQARRLAEGFGWAPPGAPPLEAPRPISPASWRRKLARDGLA